jgi:hypothetical protein
MIATSCSVLNEPDSSAPDAVNGTVVLSFGNAAAARTAYPDLRDFDHIALTLKNTVTNSSTQVTENMDTTTSSATFTVEPGNWSVSATAYADAAEKLPSIKGSTNFTVAAGSVIQANINLATVAETGAKGNFDFSVITLPAAIFETRWDINDDPNQQGPTATLTLSNLNGNTFTPVVIDLLTLHNALIQDKGTLTSILNEWKIELPEGIYNLHLNLDSGNSITVGTLGSEIEDKLDVIRDEAVYIYPYATTRLGGKIEGAGADAAGELDYLWVFEKADFQAGIWLQGTATVNGSVSGYVPAEVNIYNSYGRHIEGATTQATVVTGATGNTVTWEYYIADVTKELGWDNHDYQEGLDESTAENYAVLVEIIAVSGTKRLRSFPQRYNLTDIHGKVEGIEPSISIYSLELDNPSYGTISLDGGSGSGNDGLTALNPVSTPPSQLSSGNVADAYGRIVRNATTPAGKHFDVVGPVSSGTSDGRTPITYGSTTGFTVKVVAGANFGVQIDKTSYNGTDFTNPRYQGNVFSSPLNVTWVEYPTSLSSSDNATITAKFFTFGNATAQLTGTIGGTTRNENLTGLTINLNDPDRDVLTYGPYDYAAISVGNPYATVTPTLIGSSPNESKTWTTLAFPDKLKYLRSSTVVWMRASYAYEYRTGTGTGGDPYVWHPSSSWEDVNPSIFDFDVEINSRTFSFPY